MSRRPLVTLVAATLAVLAACVHPVPTQQAFTKPDFPRIAGVNNGGPHSYGDPAYQQKLAKLHFSIWATWPNFKPGGKTYEQCVKETKAYNPKTMIFSYVNSNELQISANDAWNEQRAKLNAEKWWLYPSGQSGSPVSSTWGTGFGIVNNTILTKKDSSGKNGIDWLTNFFVDKLYRPAPSIDGFFSDNVFWKPRVNGDWNLDGSSDPNSDPKSQTWLRQGYQRWANLSKQLMPGKYMIGNVADWGESGAVLAPEYINLLNGGVMEGMIGESYSPEAWGGWNTMMRYYRTTQAALAEPKLNAFQQDGSPTDYRSARYGLASCLLDDAYFAFNDSSKGYSGVVWFDEYDVKLGQATTPPPTAAWKQGVWRRTFTGGMSLVNPKGNGQQTVTIEAGYKRFQGTQDPVTNNGQPATSITLKDRDGILLVRTTPVTTKTPKPPLLNP